MEAVFDFSRNEEDGIQNVTVQESADPVIYQLVRVDVDGRLVPATEDEVIAVECLLENDKTKSGNPDAGRALECSTSHGCGPCGQSQHEVLEVYAEKRNVAPFPAMGSEETGDQHEEMIPVLIPNASDGSVSQSGMEENKTSNSHLGTGLKPDFSLLNGEIDLDNLSVKNLQETFKATFGRETSVKNKQWLKRRIIMGLTNSCDFSTTTFVIIDNRVVKKGKEETCTADCSVLVDCVVTSAMESHDKQNENCSIANAMQIQNSSFQENCESKDADTEQRPAKRVRKPTKRFIEELSEGESKDAAVKTVPLVKSPANYKTSAEVCARPDHDFGIDGRCLTRIDSLGGSGIQVPYVSRIRRSRPRENYMTLMPIGFGISSRLEKNDVQSNEQLDAENGNKVLKNSAPSTCIQEPACASSERKKTIQLERELKPKNMESYKTSSDDEVVSVPTANGMRRKHHRPWTLSEVVKLVEGIAKYGAGKWSEIKRLAFASYSYRTSVDLKDKWRNLLRASLAESPTGYGVS
ncbi:hypothetical protein OROGR_030514 [Orobanche gracilis]